MTAMPSLRLRVLPSLTPINGKNVELQSTATELQWRNVGDTVWQELVPLSEITGPVGPQGPKGDDGGGVPNGGLAGQVLAKLTNSDQSVNWTSAGAGDIVSVNNANDFNSKPDVRKNLLITPTVADKAALKATDTTKEQAARIINNLPFDWQVGDYSSRVTQDTLEAVYVKADAIPSSSGAWVRSFADVRGRVNFWDFLYATRSSAVREQIMNGTFTGDLAVEWTAFRNALQNISTAGGRPYGFIPECKIYTSAEPNFAMDYLTIKTHGHVRIQGMGATKGFQIDGMGLGVNGFGVRHLDIGPLCASSETGAQGVYIRRAHKSNFWGLQSLGASFAAVQVDGCVTSYFHKPTVSPQAEAFIQTPALGMYVSGTSGGAGPEPWRALVQSSWCRFDMPVMEYAGVGIQFDNAYGNMITGGTAEGCSNTGLILGAAAEWNKIIGIDLEVNTVRDLECQGKRNAFIDVDSQTIAFFTLGDCSRNRIIGGAYNQLTFDSATKRNLVLGASVVSLTDNSTGADRNRVLDVVDNSGNWTDRWITYTPTVTPASGTFTSANVVDSEYKIRDGDTVDFHFTLLITTNGTAAGSINVTLPHTVARGESFVGIEGVTNTALCGFAASGSNSIKITKPDGTYPGADSRRLLIAGTYRRS